MMKEFYARCESLARIITGSIANGVIASEAKQSIARQKEKLDCFVAALLAMTG